MNKRQKIIVSITGIFIVLLALVGLTYAYFLTQIRGNEETKSISVTTANLILEYEDGNGIITMNNVMPGDPTITKTFAVSNKGNETVENYNVYLENVQNQLELKDDLKYKLSCVQVKITDYEAYLKSTDENKSINDLEKNGTCTGRGIQITFPSVMTAIATNTIEPGYTQIFTLMINYNYKDYDQSIDMNKLVQAKVNIYDGRTKFLSSEIIKNATFNNTTNSPTGTQLNSPNYLPTKIAEEISGENERILSYTLDDLGTSYYYRGNVNDNYVNFADMCWRIVRIEGDGNIKLILEDRYTTCDDVTDSDGEGTDDYAYTGDWSIGVGNYGYDSTGKTSSGTTLYKLKYLQPVTEADNSMIKAFYDFQNTFTTNELRKMEAGNWCFADKGYSRSGTKGSYEYLLIDDITNNYLSKTAFFYDSLRRLLGGSVEGYQPTLKCNGSVLNNFESVIFNEEEIIKSVPMYVSTITADETSFAGGVYQESNLNIYLLNDYQKAVKKNNFWTLSPGAFVGTTDTSFVVYNDGSTVTNVAKTNLVDFRPVISLVSNTMITDGTGIIGDPYIID